MDIKKKNFLINYFKIAKTSNLKKSHQSLKIPNGLSESVNRRITDNTMTKEKRTKGQRSTKHTYKTKDRVT
jgi:hypothetical protein